MPLYEYECTDCRKPFEALVTASRPAACPVCQGTNLTQLLSSPGLVGAASGGRTPGASVPAGPTCGGGRCGCAH